MPRVTDALADFICRVRFEDLPQLVVEKTKLVLLDSIGCALGAYAVDRAKIITDLVEELGGCPQATIIGGRKSSYALAAFANGELINALDYDAIGPILAHVVPAIIGPSLAMAERTNASGKNLILAIAIGLEIGGRMGSALSSRKIKKDEFPYVEDAPRFSYSQAIFGAVASAGKLLNLDRKLITNAMGIAGASTPVAASVKWDHIDGPTIMVKYNVWFGWMAQLAVMSGLAAERNFTGDQTILDGEHGFWKIWGSSFFKPDKLIGELGQTWHIPGMSLKRNPVCFRNEEIVNGIIKMIEQNKIKPAEIESIIIKGDRFLQTPNRSGTELVSFADAQFRIPYAAAVAVYHGHEPGPKWQLPNVYRSQKIVNLMSKVKVELHPDDERLTEEILKSRPTRPYYDDLILEILAGGKRFSIEMSTPQTGGWMTNDEVIRKCKENASYSLLPTERVDRAIELVSRGEEISNIKDLTKFLTVG